MRYGEVLVDKSVTDLIVRVFVYIVTISFGYILYCGCFTLFCNVCVCVYVCMYGCVYEWILKCVCFGDMYTCTLRLP